MAGAPAATLDSEATFGMEVNMERPKKSGSVMISQTRTTELWLPVSGVFYVF